MLLLWNFSLFSKFFVFSVSNTSEKEFNQQRVRRKSRKKNAPLMSPFGQHAKKTPWNQVWWGGWLIWHFWSPSFRRRTMTPCRTFISHVTTVVVGALFEVELAFHCHSDFFVVEFFRWLFQMTLVIFLLMFLKRTNFQNVNKCIVTERAIEEP